MIRFDLSPDATKRIDNRHEVFAGTRYAEFDFSLSLRRLTQGEVDRINRKHRVVTGKPGAQSVDIDAEANNIELFVYTVQGWEGIGDANGPIPCTDENKAAIAKRDTLFVACVVLAARDALVPREVQEIEEKN